MGSKGLFGDGLSYGTKETADWNRAERAEHKHSMDGKRGFVMVQDGRQIINMGILRM